MPPKSRPHPGDAALVAWLSGDPDEAIAAHVQTCGRCRSRLDQWRALSDDLTGTLIETADEALSPVELTRQRESVLRRLRGRGRVLRFPSGWTTGGEAARPVAAGWEGRRWIAAAALAGLIVGTVTGRLLMGGPPPGAVAERVAGAPAVGEVPRLPSLVPASAGGDEAFLVELDAALISRGPSTLRALDELTPYDAEPARPRR